jgi:hypothetical protein
VTDDDPYPRITMTRAQLDARNAELFAGWMKAQIETKEQDR